MAELENILPADEVPEPLSVGTDETLEEETLTEKSVMLSPPPSEEITASPTSESDETDSLRRELSELREQIAERRTTEERTLRELEEFERLYPDISIEELDEGVWERVHSGLPLSAAYALCAREKELLSARAAEVNMKNAACSAGSAGLSTPHDYFSPDEVRAMSGAEVRKNYASIKKSMSYWQKTTK